MRGGGFGLVINLLLGILGGVLGGWVFALFGLAASGLIGSLITSTVGGYSCIMDCFFILKIQIGILYNLFFNLKKTELNYGM